VRTFGEKKGYLVGRISSRDGLPKRERGNVGEGGKGRGICGPKKKRKWAEGEKTRINDETAPTRPALTTWEISHSKRRACAEKKESKKVKDDGVSRKEELEAPENHCRTPREERREGRERDRPGEEIYKKNRKGKVRCGTGGTLSDAGSNWKAFDGKEFFFLESWDWCRLEKGNNSNSHGCHQSLS